MPAEGFPAPESGMLLSYFLSVADVPRSRAFYADVLGGEIVLAENPCTVRLANSWIIMNPGGGPTPDKPGITLRPCSTSGVSVPVQGPPGCSSTSDARASREVMTVPTSEEVGTVRREVLR
ncbi:VOC family protein [Streptomyces anulatus]|nr:VOC family protein [Streptomyces anulatus]